MEEGNREQFNLKSTIEQTPFEAPAVQSFFGKWCEINDGIRPQFVDRNIWEERGGIGQVLEDKTDGKKALFIPKDLQLWEMVGVMEAVDKDTFSQDLEKQIAKKEELMNLGKKFENAGVYIAQRLDSIDQGKTIAENLAVQFYDYGQSLLIGKKPDYPSSPELLMGLPPVPTEELDEVDRWLAGDRLYATRRVKLEMALADHPDEKEKMLEEARRETLARFFRVSDKAFARQHKSDTGETTPIDQADLKPWETVTPIHTGFINKIEHQMQRAVEAPRREMEGAIFRRGMELLQRNMPFDKLPPEVRDTFLAWENGESTLRDALKIDDIKEILVNKREAGGIAEIAEAERGYAHNIQQVVSSYPRREGGNNPSEILMDETINCVAASLLGGSLLSELGINYLVADIPGHSSIFLVTSDGEVEYFDMLFPELNHKLTDQAIMGQNSNGEQLTVVDIVAFSKNPRPGGISFGWNDEYYSENYVALQIGLQELLQQINVTEPAVGHKLQILGNTGKDLFRSGLYAEAAEVFKQCVALNPNSGEYLLGSALNKLEKPEEAIEIFKTGIKHHPDDADLMQGLGNALSQLDRYEEAIESYQHAIDLGLNSAMIHISLGQSFVLSGSFDEGIEEFNKAILIEPTKASHYMPLALVFEMSGQKDQAIENYKKAIELASPEQERDVITKAEEKIAKLQEPSTA